ncbi:hypothetical protein MSIMFI_00763 [Mycobacterium simulans]|uniref:hypothetical protein n=1 Tax=Mycobacterium simulans TaxID=627089 RepID=UPI00174CE9A6|nr:hypothetical protein [Mycobacterium simulans]SON59280.1 hypothetical protein MSIMFI_00763 [Mycobacterium simulans]
MVNFFFADNTVLVSFAIIGRMDLLETLFCGRGRWCPTVRDECLESAKQPDLESIAAAEGFLGEPVPPTTPELRLTREFRDQLAGPQERNPRKHLGEAETLAVMVQRYGSEILVTDDRSARRLAAEHNIVVVTTLTLLQMVVRVGLAAPEDVLEYLQLLRPRGAPYIRGVTDLRAWAGCHPLAAAAEPDDTDDAADDRELDD